MSPKSSAFMILFSVSLIASAGNMALQAVLPNIGRAFGMADTLVVAAFAVSALMWTLTSPFWARMSDKHGRKRVMMVGMAGFADRLPGALSLVAKGLGITEAQLIKLVESGQLAARDMFPASTISMKYRSCRSVRCMPVPARRSAVAHAAARSRGCRPITLLHILKPACSFLQWTVVARRA